MSRRRAATPPVTVDPAASARAAGLRYVDDRRPGIGRRRAGRAFRFVGPDGRPLRDEATLARIRALAIPPAWTAVWICPDPQGHLQATGRDARGRKQYRYHARWRGVRDETKFGRMIAFGEALPAMRARVEADLARRGIPREKVLATIVRLLETTFLRIGNTEYAKTNDSFGLTTLQNDHVDVDGAEMRFQFRGKSGKMVDVALTDRRVARVVRRCQDLPGAELFAYVDEAGEVRDVGSADVNAYLKEISGEDFTAKDFRTWAGTLLAAQELCRHKPVQTQRALKQTVTWAVKRVAEQLGNTATVCRKHYIHPAVLDSYMCGALGGALAPGEAQRASGGPEGLSPAERGLLALLRAALPEPSAGRRTA